MAESTSKKRQKLMLSNQTGTIFHSLMAVEIFYLIGMEKRIPVPVHVTLPYIPDGKTFKGIVQKVVSLKNKRRVYLSLKETRLFYSLVEFAAQCMVSEYDKELEQQVCKKFDREPKSFKIIRQYFLKFAQELIQHLNQYGIKPSNPVS